VVRARSSEARAVARARVSTAGLVKQPAPAVVSGVVMVPVSPVTTHPTGPPTGGGSTPPAVQPAVAPATPPTTTPAPPSVGDGSSALPYVPLLDPNGAAPTSPQAPSSDQVVTMVGELIGTPPPPSIGSVVDSLR
jgi:hypothetical protein